MLDVRVLTIFPAALDSFLAHGNPARAISGGFLRVEPLDIREFAEDKHRTTDDYPFGGGTGMVMKPEPVVKAIRRAKEGLQNPTTLLLSPQGMLFNQKRAEKLALCESLVLVCGRYEGYDERIRSYVDAEVSVGDYVLSGGETAAMVIIDSVSRLIPGVLGADSHIGGESFYDGLLEYPQYTRPRVFEGLKVPDVLVEGHHLKIQRWRRKQALKRTLERRPDLLARLELNDEDRTLLEEARREAACGVDK
jgi:tRNA (guanine37-N1)-methyltransferase